MLILNLEVIFSVLNFAHFQCGRLSSNGFRQNLRKWACIYKQVPLDHFLFLGQKAKLLSYTGKHLISPRICMYACSILFRDIAQRQMCTAFSSSSVVLKKHIWHAHDWWKDTFFAFLFPSLLLKRVLEIYRTQWVQPPQCFLFLFFPPVDITQMTIFCTIFPPSFWMFSMRICSSFYLTFGIYSYFSQFLILSFFSEPSLVRWWGTERSS